ncbi:MAG: hypothetical protein H2B01_02890 [Nitrosopumilaceae archaeon]|uniref:Uncharacterized protein n=1 Tax=Candidatus Nitrosomaritimum aestuariumsis TaxID=3342354 RepID=A0AC60W6V5_9ARCH|nr:hypothetical protein [Nitrosopumilaceae archaeon]
MMNTKNETQNLSSLKKDELLQEVERLQARLLELEGEQQVEKLRPDDYITVISLCPVQLTLSTLGFGRGKVFTFKRFGERKKFLYSDLVLIMENNSGFLESGFFYIADSRVIREHGLYEAYEKIIGEDQIVKIFDTNADASALEVYASANPRQKELIHTMIVNKLADGEVLNMNLISAISQKAGFSFVEASEDLKQNRLQE